MTFPTWVWLYFGTFGTIGAVLFTLVAWYWTKGLATVESSLRSAIKWTMVGLLFLFLGAWFGCGIGGPPGNLLSRDLASHDLDAAYTTAMLSIFFSAPGWACVLVGMRKVIQGAHSH